MRRGTVILSWSLAAAVAIALVGCGRVADPWSDATGPRVVTSFVPLYCFAKNVAGPDAQVLCVMGDTGPHHFDPGPHHAVAIRRADVFVINGLGLDNSIARKLIRSSRNRDVKLVEAAANIPTSQLREGGCTCGHEHGDEHAQHDPSHVHYDPHVWLGIPEAILMVQAIRDALISVDPEHRSGYESRAAAYVERLQRLADEGRALLQGKSDRKLLTFHDSLFYFARTFELEVVDSIEATPGQEPDSQKLKEIIQTSKSKGVRVIAVEPQYSSDTSARVILKALRNEGIDAEFVVVDTLETARPDELNESYYEDRMRQNLQNLAKKLK
ncbi:MAG: zinc ABC transporter substrate-binding protein [Gemmataceae bacterium]|nr:zinc ABC transporter substrate-binding protein [Gemmataceae bacterium]